MHVHLYKVSRSETLPLLETVIQNVAGVPLEQRLRQVTTRPIRMDDPMAPDDKFKGVWRLSFLKFRSEGPGRASPSTVAESIPLAEGESFSEDTAAIFDPESKALVVQYNHYGPRASAIEDYFTVWTGVQQAKYSFLLQINQAAQARLRNKKLFTRLNFRVAPDRISEHWKNANVSLADALKCTADIGEGDWISVEISMDRRDHNRSLDIFDKIQAFVGLADEPRDVVSHLEISGRDDIGEAVDPVNLINERVQKSYRDLPLDEGRRIPMEVRWNCLYDAYSTWKQSGLI
ncbi:DUF6731 family protein [Dechloromonas sp. A34]|uniref:DUF6731 family protein n=1 Tax=Dechloromonas sp. A34 TaxID=447588 RepID=UPI002B052F29|nr:DUF6731 family protein [Dechloromonas sp. A34]